MKPHLVRKDIVKIEQSEKINEAINAVKNDIKENIFTPVVISNIRTAVINFFGLCIIIAILYLFYQVCLDNYIDTLENSKKEQNIFAYNSFL